MLDYSDDEEPDPVRRRNRSPSDRTGSAVHANKKKQRAAALKSRTVRDANKQIMPRTVLPASDAFVINEFVRDKTFQPSNSQLYSFNLSLKGKKLFFHEPPLNASTDDGDDHPDSFFKSMKTSVFLSQFFAVFPVSGYKGPNYKSLRFKWLHFRTCYWFLTFLGTLFCTVCSVADTLRDGSFQAETVETPKKSEMANRGTMQQIERKGEVFFFVCGIVSSLLMLNLSRNWKQLSKEFAQVEVKLKKFGYPKKINFKFKIFTASVLCGALVEHVLSKLKNFQMLDCYNRKSGYVGAMEAFFWREYYHIFSLIPFNLSLGFLLLTAQFLTTANWNFKDLFLCLISWTIAERFRQIQDLLDSVHGEEKPISFWKEARENYNALSVLTKRVDARIQNLMLLSIGNNVFFICMQLFRSLKKTLSATKLVYFFWSFGFLVLRACFVAFSAARINDESKEPKTVLYSVPQKNYTTEVRRFLTQLTTNEVALTGSGFFSVTRSLILTITGTVITYEIVLAQFGADDSEEVPVNSTICSVLHS